MELNRKYLTSEELVNIVNELVKHESAVEREIIKQGMVAQCLIDGMDKYDNCNEMYDKLMEDGIDLEIEVANYYMIDKLVGEEMGVESILRNFVKSFDGKLKDFDFTKGIEQLKGVMGNVNK